jgi:hypothetical protein
MRWIALLLFLLASLAVACGNHDAAAPACVTPPAADCKPLDDPVTYSTLWQKTFHPTCATGTGTCHTSDSVQGGIDFSDADRAYAALLGQTGGHARVVPGDPGCSLLMERLESTDPSFHMPKGPNSLLPAEICAIATWIRQGAPR